MDTPATSDAGLILVPVAMIMVFWSAYVYRPMPKLNLGNSRRWARTAVVVKKNSMRSIEDDLRDSK